MPRGPKKREIKSEVKQEPACSDKDSNLSQAADGNEIGSERPGFDEEDEFLLKRYQDTRCINLFLMLPDEPFGEVVRQVKVTFYDTTKNLDEDLDLHLHVQAS